MFKVGCDSIAAWWKNWGAMNRSFSWWRFLLENDAILKMAFSSRYASYNLYVRKLSVNVTSQVCKLVLVNTSWRVWTVQKTKPFFHASKLFLSGSPTHTPKYLLTEELPRSLLISSSSRRTTITILAVVYSSKWLKNSMLFDDFRVSVTDLSWC